MKAFWQIVRESLEAGQRVHLSLVASGSKGSPGTPKAAMAITEDGHAYGTIGGGIMERDAQLKARAELAAGEDAPKLQTLDHNRQSEHFSGLICGGSQRNATVILNAQKDLGTVNSILDAFVNERPAAISLSPAGLQLEELAQPMLEMSRLEGDGDCWALKRSLVNLRRVVVFGAGHCGQALAAQLQRIGFSVTLVDERDAPYLRVPHPQARVYLGEEPSAVCPQLPYWRHTAAIVMTHSYPTDLNALKAILPLRPAFVGLMGAPPKLKKIFRELAEAGISQSEIDQLHAPVGLQIGSDTPEEIAVSVSAQLIQFYNTFDAIHDPRHADHTATQ